jgi:hypothetical protein
VAATLEDTIIEERIKKICKTHSVAPDAAFVSWVHSLLFDTDEGEVPKEDLMDGAQEKQIDTINIDDDAPNNRATRRYQISGRSDGQSDCGPHAGGQGRQTLDRPTIQTHLEQLQALAVRT